MNDDNQLSLVRVIDPPRPRRCLHCDQTRAEIKTNQTICGIAGGYEYVELEHDWPRHRWADWTDKDLDRFGILPEAFERHRRTQVTNMQWVSCIDTKRGHTYPEHDNPEWGDRTDQCISCGHRSLPFPDVDHIITASRRVGGAHVIEVAGGFEARCDDCTLVPSGWRAGRRRNRSSSEQNAAHHNKTEHPTRATKDTDHD